MRLEKTSKEVKQCHMHTLPLTVRLLECDSMTCGKTHNSGGHLMLKMEMCKTGNIYGKPSEVAINFSSVNMQFFSCFYASPVAHARLLIARQLTVKF